MRARSLSVMLLLPVLSVLLTAAPAQAAVEYGASAPMSGVWKNSAYRRPGVLGAPTARTTAASPGQAYQDRVLVRTNDERRARGLAPLALSPCADRFADSWAASQAQRDTMSHQPLEPILAECGASLVGENVGYGNITPDELVQMWMQSAGHRENILRPGITHIGVGAVSTSSGRWYGVQVFLRL